MDIGSTGTPPGRKRGLGRPLLALLLAALAGDAAAQAVELRAPEEIRRLVAPHLPEEPFADPVARAHVRQDLAKSLPEFLATEGYFTPRLDFREDGEDLVIVIDPGPRTRVASVDLSIAGNVDAPRRQALAAGWKLPVGQPFRQADWNTAKLDILSQLLSESNAGATLTDSLADIDPDAGQAHLRAHYDAGPAYRLGPVKIEGLSRYPPELVERYNRTVHPGDPYRADRLTALQNALQATPYFSSVQVELQRSDSEGEGAATAIAPVRVLVRETAPHRLSLGGGFSSNTGARVEANYHTADLFRNAWEFNGGLRLEQKRQIAYGDIFLPPSPGNYRHSFGTLLEHTDIQGLATERFAIGAQRLQQRGEVEMRLLLNWQEERQRPEGALPRTDRALVANSIFTWRHVDSILDPRRGTVAQVQIGGAARALLSDRDFLRLYGRFQQYIPLGRSNVLTLRGELGQTLAGSRRGIPQDYLFRAGGTNSVRGYSYQRLGVREGEAIVGGRYLATASVEFTHWLNERWGVAAFVDAGEATDSRRDFRAALGYGLGARWKSPAGPIAVDLAYGERVRKFQLHFSLSIPF